MVNPAGPVYTNRFEEFVVNDENGEEYTILYLADLNNDKLQADGKSAVYYRGPGSVRMARKGDTGDYKFRHVHFVGVFDEDLHVGVEGNSEVAGGLLAFTTTSRYPTSVLKKADEQLLAKFKGSSDKYWGWRTPVAPQFAMAPITSNTTLITSLAPGSDGTAPVENAGTPANPGGAPGAPGAPRNLVRKVDPNQKIVHGREFRSGSAIDAWAWNMQGQGPGSVTGGENAYAGIIGALPSELVWAGFHGGYSPIAVVQNLVMPVWSQEIYIKIEGKWDRIAQHFSAHANANYLWFAGDIKAEFNQLRINGGIKVELQVDGTIPNAAEMGKEIDDRIDLIVSKFMEQATQIIFEPAPLEVEPAEAPSGGFFSRFFGGARFAFKYRRDEQHLDLYYEETRHHRYNQSNTISSSLEGFFNEIKADPDAEQKYFTRLILGDLSRKVTRIVKPVVNWPDPGKEWVGEPAAFLSAEIGYPDAEGSLQWLPHIFQSTDTSAETNWKPAFALRNLEEVNNPPSGWSPDKTFVRRRVHLTEPSGITDNPYVKLLVEKNEILLDPDENGTLMSDSIVEVRADSVGKLEVRMTGIDVVPARC